MTAILKTISKENSTLLDVGVNIGQTLLTWKSIQPNACYIGFEPNRHCVKYVKYTVKVNAFERCIIEPFGLSTISEKSELFLLGRDLGDSTASTIKDFRQNENRQAIEIETKSLKELGHTNFDIAKVDVEGSELEAIRAIIEVNTTSMIICEILPVYSKENIQRIERQEQIETLLKDNDYYIYRILKGDKITLASIQEFGIHSELSKSDYLFVPSSKDDFIKAAFH
jgi:FkbM family methyltransferase